MLSKIDDIDLQIVTLQKHCEELENFPSDETVVAIKNLYLCAIQEAERIKESPQDIYTIAISVRNLFEIYMISLYLKKSDEIINQWYGQLLKDVLDIQEGLISLFSKHGIHNSNLELAREQTINSGLRNGVEQSKPFNIKGIAKQLGWEEDYDAIYKLCSKIVHPSSVKVNLPNAFEKNDEYIGSLVHVAIHYMHLIVDGTKHKSV
ncbi:MAG TPA: hypothetical protein DIW64_03335 [Cellvibrio sp.]|nr:hypothetical protein [Cellvibrio sp.]